MLFNLQRIHSIRHNKCYMLILKTKWNGVAWMGIEWNRMEWNGAEQYEADSKVLYKSKNIYEKTKGFLFMLRYSNGFVRCRSFSMYLMKMFLLLFIWKLFQMKVLHSIVLYCGRMHLIFRNIQMKVNRLLPLLFLLQHFHFHFHYDSRSKVLFNCI